MTLHPERRLRAVQLVLLIAAALLFARVYSDLQPPLLGRRFALSYVTALIWILGVAISLFARRGEGKPLKWPSGPRWLWYALIVTAAIFARGFQIEQQANRFGLIRHVRIPRRPR